MNDSAETKTIQIRAADSRRVLDPRTMQPLPADGLAVSPTDTGWYRRWLDGDVEVFDPASGAIVVHPADPQPEPEDVDEAPAAPAKPPRAAPAAQSDKAE